jgi:hypothetical protein
MSDDYNKRAKRIAIMQGIVILVILFAIAFILGHAPWLSASH